MKKVYIILIMVLCSLSIKAQYSGGINDGFAAGEMVNSNLPLPISPWISYGPPGRISCLTANGFNLYAGTHNGVLISTNNGSQWSDFSSGLPENTEVTGICIKDTNIIIASSSGVYIRGRNSQIWSSRNSGLPQYLFNLSVCTSGNNIFVGTYTDGVYLSTNNGISWTAVNSGLLDLDIRSISVNGSNLFAGTNDGVYLSTNNGTSWTFRNSGIPANSLITSFAFSGSNNYVCTYGDGIYHSTNNGMTWTSVTFGFILSLKTIGTSIYAGTGSGQGMYYSTNNGQNWSSLNTGLPANTSVFGVEVIGSNLFAATSYGIYHSSNNGQSWTAANNGNHTSDVIFLNNDNDILYASTQESGLYSSTNNGINWTPINNGTPSNSSAGRIISNGTNLYGIFNGGVFKSEDSGLNWTWSNGGMVGFWVNDIASNGAFLFAATAGGIYFSISGDNWSLLPGISQQSNIKKLFINGNNIYAAAAYGPEVYLSTNNGDTWALANGGLPQSFDIADFAINGINIFAASAEEVYSSTNNGQTWTSAGAGLPYYPGINSLHSSGSYLYASTYDNGIYFSNNDGQNWAPIDSGLPDIQTNCLTSNENKVFVGTFRGGVYINTAPTNAPVLKFPINNAISIRKSFAFKWRRAEFAAAYHLQVSADSNFTNLLVNSTSLIDTSFSITGLTNNTTYYWRVLSFNAVGKSVWSSIWKFTTFSECVLLACGDNDFGQLGDGTIIDRIVPVQIGTDSNWAYVSCSSLNTMAIKSSGTLWAWGNNSSGQLGDGTTIDRTAPVRVGTDSNWAYVSCGGSFTAALKSNGTLWAWGSNSAGQLGDGTTIQRTTPVQIGTGTNWASVSSGSMHTVAIKNDGTLWAWGSNNWYILGIGGNIAYSATPLQIGTDTNWNYVSAGQTHVMAIKKDGSLWTWGSGYYGQMGLDTIQQSTATIRVGTDNNWDYVKCGVFHTIAKKNNGTIWGWGMNMNGVLGDSTIVNIFMPVQIGSESNWSKVFSGASNTIAKKNNGTFWAWGSNNSGQLLDGTTIQRNLPVQIGSGMNWHFISSGENHTMILQNSSSPSVAPILNFPSNNSVTQTINPNLEWSSLSNSISYTLQVSTDSNFTSLIINETEITGTSYQISGLIANTSYYWRVRADFGNSVSDWSSVWNFTTPAPTGFSLTGTLTYANTAQTPLGNCIVILKNASLFEVARDTTDAAGNWQISNLDNYTYNIEVQTTKTPGGINVGDILLMRQSIAGLIVLNSLQFKAADINANGSVNVQDALPMRQKIAGISPIASWLIAPFVYHPLQVTINGANAVLNIQALSGGDVNGSYTPVD